MAVTSADSYLRVGVLKRVLEDLLPVLVALVVVVPAAAVARMRTV